MRYYVLRNGSNLYRFSSMITCAVKLKLRDNHDYKEAEMFEARLSFLSGRRRIWTQQQGLSI